MSVYKREYKFLVFGADGSGKTTLAHKSNDYIVKGDTIDNLDTNYRKLVRIENGQEVVFDVNDPYDVDLKGSKLAVFRKGDYKRADCFVLVCDLTRKESLAELKPLIDGVLWARNSPLAPFVVVGNKSDAPQDQQTVTDADLDAVAAQLGAPFILVSAKTGENVAETFMLALKQAVQHESPQAKASAKPQSGLQKLIARLFGE